MGVIFVIWVLLDLGYLVLEDFDLFVFDFASGFGYDVEY